MRADSNQASMGRVDTTGLIVVWVESNSPKRSGPKDSLDRWERWIDMLSDEPLDKVEFVELLNTRSEVPVQLEIHGDEESWDRLDRLDLRFKDLTVASPGYPFHDQANWWAQRLPIEQDDRLYIAKDVAAAEVRSGADLGNLAKHLRHDYMLSPMDVVRALQEAGIPLRECKPLVDQTLTAEEQLATEHVRNLAIESIESLNIDDD
jgi:hypothetical protein